MEMHRVMQAHRKIDVRIDVNAMASFYFLQEIFSRDRNSLRMERICNFVIL